jgi:O-antigen/teichoic acid export membrane protein
VLELSKLSVQLRKLSSSVIRNAVLYALADALVLGVGGFLLLPLYTRSLSQEEFGMYVVVRANSEVFTYLLFLGLPSAATRLYFDHRTAGDAHAYFSSILVFYVCSSLVFAGTLGMAGEYFWHSLSPSAPAHPYMWLAFLVAFTSFFSSITLLWLRLEEKAASTLAMQSLAAGVLIVIVSVALLTAHAGVMGIFVALCASQLVPTLKLKNQFGGKFQMRIRWSHIRESAPYAAPILIGYLAYFVLNRFGMIVLQRYASLSEVAAYGLAQQLCLIVALAGAAMGKAVQPAIFSADGSNLAATLRQHSRILIASVFCVTSGLVLAGPMILRVLAPVYAAQSSLLSILAIGAFAQAVSLLSDTAIIYHRRPRTSLLVSLLGAVSAAVLSFLLVPVFKAEGAAISTAVSFLLMMLFGQSIVRRLLGHTQLGLILVAMLLIVAVAILSTCIGSFNTSIYVDLLLRAVVLLIAWGVAAYALSAKSVHTC